MTSGIQSGGSDLDTLFMPIGAFTPIANVGIQVGGVDIANRYAGAAHGTPYGTTHIQSSGGTDIGTLFAAQSTNSLIAATGMFSLSGQAVTFTSPNIITLTAGSFSPAPGDTDYGYASFGGSVSPTTISGYTIAALFSSLDTVAHIYGDEFRISASSDPGASLFTTMTVGAKSRSFASATYSYSAGTAIWHWSGSPDFNALFTSATTYSVSIV